MRFLVNLLSTTNASGRYVLVGHLSRLAAATRDRHEYVVLFHEANRDLRESIHGTNLSWVECPAGTSNWMHRATWERANIENSARRHGCGAVFSGSGLVTPGIDLPQASIAMNPWALVPDVMRTIAGELKAGLQRRGYRATMKEASGMAFLSDYMHDAYRENSGVDVPMARVTYAGIDDDTFATAERLSSQASRKPLQIVSVSVMARHKGVETLVAALARLRGELGVPATLRLVGGWPEARYRGEIEAQVRRGGLSDVVSFDGHVTCEELHRAYAEAQVFCLMSRCESFGIPAVEAQTFGTPVVSSNRCAIPEVCGDGGIFPDPDRPDEVAAALARLLTERDTWNEYSKRARANAERFQWDVVSKPFVELFDELAKV